MGSLGDNLLKLTEFPFSYSFIGLLALIFGEGLNLGEASLDKLGPLLILMGFVATTLSITDPFGALQKYTLKGLNRESAESLHLRKGEEICKDEFEKKRIFGEKLVIKGGSENSGELDDVKTRLRRKSPQAKSLFASRAIRASLSYDFLKTYSEKPKSGRSFEEMDDMHRFDIYLAVLSLRESTLRTKWVTREIDKITSMFYFIIVILTFIIALIHIQNFEDKFIAAFQVGNQPGGSANQTTGGGGATTGGNQPGGSERDTITGGGADTSKQSRAGSLDVRIIIFVFSYIAIWAILYMLFRRLRDLRRNALIAFQFLMTQLAYRIAQRANKNIKDDIFKQTLDEVEKRYLDNGDWALARFSVGQLIQDYRYLFWEKIQVGPRL